MNERQKRFVDEYLLDPSPGQAAAKAGYSTKSAVSIGGKLLKKAEIREAVAKRLEMLESGRIMAVREVLERLSQIARGESDGEGLEAKRPSVREALSALELLGKRYGVFTDRNEQNPPVTIIIEDDYGE